MKKAKDYAEEFRVKVDDGVDSGQAAADAVVAMCLEIEEIAKMRHAKSDGAMTAIVLEQSRKWKAFVARVDKRFGLKESGFALYFRKAFEEVANEMPVEVLRQML